MGLSALEADAVAHDVHTRCEARVALLRRLAELPGELPPPPRRWWQRPRPTAPPRAEEALAVAHRRAVELGLRAERAAAEVAALADERAAVAACRSSALAPAERVLAELHGLFVAAAGALSRLHGEAEAEARRWEGAAAEAAASQAERARLVRPAEGSVRRVDLAGLEGVVVAERLDRVRHELDLWGAGSGPAWRAAEREVTLALGDVVARWRSRRGGGG